MSNLIEEIDSFFEKYGIKPLERKDFIEDYVYLNKTQKIDKTRYEYMKLIYARDGIIIRR